MTHPLGRHAGAAIAQRPATGGLWWAVLLLVSAASLISTTNPVHIFSSAAMAALAAHLLGDIRRQAFRVAAALGVIAFIWRLATALLAGGGGQGLILLSLPSWRPAPGVVFGGPISLQALAVGLTDGVRTFAMFALVGVACMAVSGAAWGRTTRHLFGRGAEALLPSAHIGDSIAAAWRSSRVQAAQGWRVGALSRWESAFRSAAGTADPGQDREPTWVAPLRPGCILLVAAVPVILAAGWLPGTIVASLSPLGIAACAAVPWLLLAAPRERLTPVAACALLSLFAFVARAWLIGHDELAWQPSAGWPGIPFSSVIATLLLPIAALLAEGGDDA